MYVYIYIYIYIYNIKNKSLFVWIFGLKIHVIQLIKIYVSMDDLDDDLWDPA